MNNTFVIKGLLKDLPFLKNEKNETCTLNQYYNNTLKLYICSREKVSFTRHDYRFTYRKIGNRFVLLAYALYSSQYILQYLSSSASCNSFLALVSIRPNTWKKTFVLKSVYRFPITIKC